MPGVSPAMVVPGTGWKIRDCRMDLLPLPKQTSMPCIRPKGTHQPRGVGWDDRSRSTTNTKERSGSELLLEKAVPTRRRTPGYLMGHGPRRSCPMFVFLGYRYQFGSRKGRYFKFVLTVG